MSENKNRWIFTKIGVITLLVSYLIIGVSNSIVINNEIERLRPKLVVFGVVNEMDYWNITVEDVYYNLFNSFGDKRNITIYLYNLTIFNFLSFSYVIYGFELGIIRRYNIQINSFIIIREHYPFLELEVWNYGSE